MPSRAALLRKSSDPHPRAARTKGGPGKRKKHSGALGLRPERLALVRELLPRRLEVRGRVVEGALLLVAARFREGRLLLGLARLVVRLLQGGLGRAHLLRRELQPGLRRRERRALGLLRGLLREALRLHRLLHRLARRAQ